MKEITYKLLLGILLAFSSLGCGSEDPIRIEGTEPGDCTDGADNDADGFFDCEDMSCLRAPACLNPEGGTDAAAEAGKNTPDAAKQPVSDAALDASGDADSSLGDAGVDAASGPIWDGGGGCDPAPAVQACSGGNKATYVLSVINSDVSEYDQNGDPTSSLGFDLDCTEGLSCPCANYCDDLPSTKGVSKVDNQFAFLHPVLDQAFSLSSGFEQSISEGDMLLVLEVDGLDAPAGQSLSQDDCVTVSLIPVKTSDGSAPKLTQTGTLLAGQNFVALPTAVDNSDVPLIRGKGVVDKGALTVRLPSAPLVIQFDGPASMELLDVSLKVTLSDKALSDGFFAGGIDVPTFLASLNMQQPGLGDPGTLVSNLLYGFADLVPSQAKDSCTSISATMKFEAVEASWTAP